jgi:hypothetical protein
MQVLARIRKALVAGATTGVAVFLALAAVQGLDENIKFAATAAAALVGGVLVWLTPNAAA